MDINLNRSDLAYTIGMFLAGKGLNASNGIWKGKAAKSTQIKAFGFYLGTGTLLINGEDNTIQRLEKVGSGSLLTKASIDGNYPEKTRAQDSTGADIYVDGVRAGYFGAVIGI